MCPKIKHIKKKYKNMQKQKCLLNKKFKRVSELLCDLKEKHGMKEEGYSILQACFGEMDLKALLSKNLKKKKNSLLHKY